MRLFRHLAPEPEARAGYVATIGGFDGIHLGHRALIGRAMARARQTGRASMIVTFEPLPKEFLSPQDPPARLTSLRERWRLLEQDGPDVFCALRFNSGMRAMSAERFALMLLGAGVRAIVIGHDFRAGHGGEATAAWFESEGRRLGMEVEVVEPVMSGDVRIGSGAIRAALASGNLGLAKTLLGRPYSMRGRVVKGEQLGRKLGFPTANLRLARRRSAMNGIFAVRVRGTGNGAAGHGRHGVASLGTRPTVGGRVPLLEAHVFDFSGDIYGREIEVEFVARLRDELKFESVDEMVRQMHRDAAAARSVLSG
jgi:riboflavin kinase / FMN adenylyltransferase